MIRIISALSLAMALVACTPPCGEQDTDGTTDIDSGTDVDTEVDTEADSDPDSDPDSDSDVDTEADSDTDPDSDTDSDTDTDPDTTVIDPCESPRATIRYVMPDLTSMVQGEQGVVIATVEVESDEVLYLDNTDFSVFDYVDGTLATDSFVSGRATGETIENPIPRAFSSDGVIHFEMHDLPAITNGGPGQFNLEVNATDSSISFTTNWEVKLEYIELFTEDGEFLTADEVCLELTDHPEVEIHPHGTVNLSVTEQGDRFVTPNEEDFFMATLKMGARLEGFYNDELGLYVRGDHHAIESIKMKFVNEEGEIETVTRAPSSLNGRVVFTGFDMMIPEDGYSLAHISVNVMENISVGGNASNGDQFWLEFDSASLETFGEHSYSYVTPVEVTSMVTQAVTVRTLDLSVETYALAPSSQISALSDAHVHSVIFHHDQYQDAVVTEIEACITGSPWTQSTSVDVVDDDGNSVVDSDGPIVFVNGCAVIPTEFWVLSGGPDKPLEFNINASMATALDNLVMTVVSFTAVDEDGIESTFSRPEEGLPAEGHYVYF